MANSMTKVRQNNASAGPRGCDVDPIGKARERQDSEESEQGGGVVQWWSMELQHGEVVDLLAEKSWGLPAEPQETPLTASLSAASLPRAVGVSAPAQAGV